MACGRKKHRMQFEKLFVKFSIIKFLRAHKKRRENSQRGRGIDILPLADLNLTPELPLPFNWMNNPFEYPIQ